MKKINMVEFANDLLGGKEKTYDAVIKVEWATSFEAKSKEDFIKKAKEQWKQDYDIELVDDEIKILEEE